MSNKQWTNPLIKKDTHFIAKEMADLLGMKVWKIYEKAIVNLKMEIDKDETTISN